MSARPLHYLAALALGLGLFSNGASAAALVFEATTQRTTAPLGAEAVAFVYPFVNTSEEPVRIVEQASSCGCTIPQADELRVEPGAKGVLPVRFEIGERRGHQAKTLTVVTDAGERHVLRFEVFVPSALAIKPQLLRWQGDSGWKTARISRLADAGLGEPRIVGAIEHFEAGLQPDGEGAWVVRVRPSPGAQPSGVTALEVAVDGPDGAVHSERLFLLAR